MQAPLTTGDSPPQHSGWPSLPSLRRSAPPTAGKGVYAPILPSNVHQGDTPRDRRAAPSPLLPLFLCSMPSYRDGACLIDSICPTVKTLCRCQPPSTPPSGRQQTPAKALGLGVLPGATTAGPRGRPRLPRCLLGAAAKETSMAEGPPRGGTEVFQILIRSVCLSQGTMVCLDFQFQAGKSCSGRDAIPEPLLEFHLLH